MLRVSLLQGARTIPRDPSGQYSLPSTYFATAGQTIRTEQHNPPLEDLAQAVTASLARDGRGGMVGPLDMGTFPVRNLAPGSAATDAATVGQAGAPVGSVIDYAGATPPATWFFCDGREISRADYPVLFAVIGTIYGGGNGSTTFNLPDCRGRVVAGKDNMGGTSANRLTNQPGGVNGNGVLGATGGAESHVLTDQQLAPHVHGGTTQNETVGHTHSFSVPSGVGVVPGGTAALAGGGSSTSTTSQPSNSHQHNFITNSSGLGTPHNNVQPTIILHKIIKALIS